MRLARALTLAVLASLLPFAAATPAEATKIRTHSGPNVVLIYTDDMRADDLQYMDYTRSLFAAEGTTFTHAISPNPLCCPARATMMTGQHSQNNGVHYNRGTWGGYDALVGAGMTKLTPQWFRSDGYRTAYLGKYLNGYEGGDIPGVEVTDTLVRKVYDPTGFSTWNNGTITERGKHQTDWTSYRTAGLIEQFKDDQFFITAAYLAPHVMKAGGEWVPPYRTMAGAGPSDLPIAPRRYDTLQPGDEVPPSYADPAYNEPDMGDKPSPVRDRAPIDNDSVLALHQARVLSLYAVDDAVKRTVAALKNAGVYDNTVLAFTSDNGFLMGEHRIKDKDQPYQQSLRIPLLIKGPGVGVGTNPNLVTTVDIPGTLAGLAGVTPNRVQDGISAFASTPDRAVLIQSGTEASRWDWRGVYTRRYTYVEHYASEVEFYDRNADPHEQVSTPGTDAAVALGQMLPGLRTCVGQTCQREFSGSPDSGGGQG